MRIVVFCRHFDTSHFMRGIVTDLRDRGCEIVVSDDDVSRDFDELLDSAGLVLAQAGVPPELLFHLSGNRLRGGNYQLLFHDPAGYGAPEYGAGGCRAARCRPEDVSGFDGVLAGTEAIRQGYMQAGWTRSCWTWHEAVDTSVFHPVDRREKQFDLVWLGETASTPSVPLLYEFLLDPATDLNLGVSLYGAEYPEAMQAVLRFRGVDLKGGLAPERAPEILSAFRAAIHIPQAPFSVTPILEALACGTPLVSGPWEDADRLFTPGEDYLLASSGEEMREHLQQVMEDDRLCASLSLHGLQTIFGKHTCAHRVDELISIYEQLTSAGQFHYALLQ